MAATGFAHGSAATAEIRSSSLSRAQADVVLRGFDRFFGNTKPAAGLSAFQSSADGSRAGFSGLQMPAPGLSFDGLSNRDNAEAYSLLILPPDMVGEAGTVHYVQIANSLFIVFDRSGNPLSNPIRLSDLFAPLGTVCSTRKDGLPNVIYDQLADRWLISQVCSAFPPFRQMIAVSKTADPGGEYFLYEFVMPNVRINDFPKFGMWPDAYYMTTDEFLGSDYVGSGMFAFDRDKMLLGDPSAKYIYFNLALPIQPRRKGMLPADLDGYRLPPAGSAAIFASYNATEYGDAQDAIRLFAFRPDFAVPSGSTFAELAESPIAVATFDPTSPDGRADIAQPPPGEFVDSQSDRINHRLAYRNFGSHESLTVNQTVRMTAVGTTYRAGVRVYELRRENGVFAPHFQPTIGDSGSSRWIGSAAQDHSGNLAVQYNFVSDEKRISILYTGRQSGDPPNTLRLERSLIEGTGVQKAFGFRWGEYSGMNVDPVDDCTFWLTNAYYTLESEKFSDLGWLTRIGTFKFEECSPAQRGRLRVTARNAATNEPIPQSPFGVFPDAAASGASFTFITNQDGVSDTRILPPGQYRVAADLQGYLPASTEVFVTAGPTISTAEILLVPVPVIEAAGSELAAESCVINNVPEPGERVTLNITLWNSGARAAEGLTAELLEEGGITAPGPPQNFGTIDPGGESTRPFVFTVIPSVKCGALLALKLRVNAQSGYSEYVDVPLRTGSLSVAFSENFDNATAPGLPAGWSTTASENHQLWRTTESRFESPPNAAFSPAPVQRGVNEFISPAFSIETASAEVRFRHWYELETTFLRNRLFDGAVMEIKIGGGDWQDILAAGGSFTSGGYDGIIDGCCQNPLAGRLGWSGRSGVNQTSEWIDTAARLPASAAGQTVRLRWRVGTDIGTFREGMYIDDLVVTDGYVCDCDPRTFRAPFDLDGDGKTDLSVFSFSDEPSAPDFRVLKSSSDQIAEVSFGSIGDVPAAADFDGDGRTDIAVYRPSSGTWFVLRSSDGNITVTRFGIAEDVPAAGDFDVDAKADIAVFRPSTGTWYILRSGDSKVTILPFGLADDIPVPGDFDGDGKDDIAVFRPSNGFWYVRRSGDSGVTFQHFGQNGDVPVAADLDGDGRTDNAVFRPGTGIWYVLGTAAGFSAAQFGLAGDIPLKADLDGDGRADIAVYRPSTGVWYAIRSSNGQFLIRTFGTPPEMPLPRASSLP